ncbi:unnamed protein product, partial [marine sediment metagenome]
MSPGPSAVRLRPIILSAVAAVLLIACSGLLLLDALLPLLGGVGWDESAYVHRGFLATEGFEIRLADSPLTGLAYSAGYLAFGSSPVWLVQSARAGRVISFVLLWAGALLVAGALRSQARCAVFVALVAFAPTLRVLLDNPADAAFAALSGFALAFFLAFLQEGRALPLVLASAATALGALARPDGLVLAAVLFVLAIAFGRRRGNPLRAAAAAALPFVALVGGYVLLLGGLTGDYSLGLAQRTYTAFEQGYGIAFGERFSKTNKYAAGIEECR